MIEIPTVTFGGDATALLFENHAGSDLEVLAHTRYDDNPRAFLDLVSDKLRTHYPITARRVNEHKFDLANSPLDILQGGVTPTVRHGHVKLANGATAVLLVTPTPPSTRCWVRAPTWPPTQPTCWVSRSCPPTSSTTTSSPNFGRTVGVASAGF